MTFRRPDAPGSSPALDAPHEGSRYAAQARPADYPGWNLHEPLTVSKVEAAEIPTSTLSDRQSSTLITQHCSIEASNGSTRVV